MDDTADLRATILSLVADVAGVEASEISERATLDSLGLDSSDAAVVALEIERRTGHGIDVTLFLRTTTVGEAADEIVKAIGAAG